MAHYTCRQVGTRYIVSVDNHADLIPALTEFCVDKKIAAGIISGIGAVDRARLGFFDFDKRQYAEQLYEEQMEMASLNGNITTKDGRPYLHLHATFGKKDYSVVGGHLVGARIYGACELFIETIDQTILRTMDNETGINLIRL
ncbi:MAG: DNA-binding protein [Paludibacteraceae bacterium]|nr:DNA-binding protein [Paludibacteraceae bacterium]